MHQPEHVSGTPAREDAVNTARAVLVWPYLTEGIRSPDHAHLNWRMIALETSGEKDLAKSVCGKCSASNSELAPKMCYRLLLLKEFSANRSGGEVRWGSSEANRDSAHGEQPPRDMAIDREKSPGTESCSRANLRENGQFALKTAQLRLCAPHGFFTPMSPKSCCQQNLRPW